MGALRARLNLKPDPVTVGAKEPAALVLATDSLANESPGAREPGRRAPRLPPRPAPLGPPRLTPSLALASRSQQQPLRARGEVREHGRRLPLRVPERLRGAALRDGRQRVPFGPLPERRHLPGQDRGLHLPVHARYAGQAARGGGGGAPGCGAAAPRARSALSSRRWRGSRPRGPL